ncbi:MAG: RNA polymerase sigma factor SigZ [Akkermansiaceae bacterium]
MNHLDDIWHTHSKKLAAFIRSKVEPDAVDDLLQNVFLKAHQRLDSLKEESRLESWLYQITRNTIIDHYRSRQTKVEFDEKFQNDNPAEDETAQQEFSKCMAPMISRLPEKYRQVITLTEIEQRPHKEAADELGISVSAVKSRVLRGREMLKGVFQECCKIEFNRHNQIISYENIDGTCDDS